MKGGGGFGRLPPFFLHMGGESFVRVLCFDTLSTNGISIYNDFSVRAEPVEGQSAHLYGKRI